MLGQAGAVARGGELGMPEFSSRRAKGPEGYRDYLVKRITYAKGEIVTKYVTGTVYHWKKGNFVCRDSPLTGEARLIATKSFGWEWTVDPCPTCFDNMCEPYIKLGWCRKWS
jgi:hypothetical protein